MVQYQGNPHHLPNLIVGKGLAPSGGEMLHIRAIPRQIRKIIHIRNGFFVIYWYLLPEGAEPLPYVSADSPCGFAWESANFGFSPASTQWMPRPTRGNRICGCYLAGTVLKADYLAL